MKRVIIMLLLFSAALLLTAAEKFSYSSVGVCGMCHRGQANHMIYEKWLASKHALAFKALNPAKGEDKNQKCLACHTTGFGSGGYASGAPNAAKFEGVQCEACHGAGSAYKAVNVMKDRNLALANGLVIPTVATCKRCHGVTNPKAEEFDFAESLKKIDHRYRGVK